MTRCFADGTCEITSPQEMEKAIERMRQVIDGFDFEELFSREY
jgi:hypothetical protein